MEVVRLWGSRRDAPRDSPEHAEGSDRAWKTHSEAGRLQRSRRSF